MLPPCQKTFLDLDLRDKCLQTDMSRKSSKQIENGKQSLAPEKLAFSKELSQNLDDHD